jgi:pimeloyl-ACP methyl ester carboxylesterase
MFSASFTNFAMIIIADNFRSDNMKKFLYRLLIVLTVLYLGGCAYMYFMQESFIFHPDKLAKNEVITFGPEDKEITLQPEAGIELSSILSRSKQPERKRLVFFLHGNAGNLMNQEQPANYYTSLGYDFFTFDYRSFGKSNGEITDQEQFFSDVEYAYNEMKKIYTEDSIVVIGYSVGTGSAAMITARKEPSKLVLIAPYFSLVDMTTRQYPIIPTFLLKYKFETNEFLKKINEPVLLVHGDKDEVLPFDGSQKLAKLLNKKSRFVAIPGQGHDDFEFNSTYNKEVEVFLK